MIEFQKEADRRKFKVKRETTPAGELKELYGRRNSLIAELDRVNMRIRAIEMTTPWELRRPE